MCQKNNIKKEKCHDMRIYGKKCSIYKWDAGEKLFLPSSNNNNNIFCSV